MCWSGIPQEATGSLLKTCCSQRGSEDRFGLPRRCFPAALLRTCPDVRIPTDRFSRNQQNRPGFAPQKNHKEKYNQIRYVVDSVFVFYQKDQRKKTRLKRLFVPDDRKHYGEIFFDIFFNFRRNLK